ncbi:hypothetical protein WME88_24595 [Sorangium sp. So ce216]
MDRLKQQAAAEGLVFDDACFARRVDRFVDFMQCKGVYTLATTSTTSTVEAGGAQRLDCGPAGICVIGPGEGEPCDHVCAEGLYCDGDAKVCVRDLPFICYEAEAGDEQP